MEGPEQPSISVFIEDRGERKRKLVTTIES